MKNKMKRTIAIICALLVAATVLGACGKSVVKDPNVAMTINDKAVDQDVFEYMTNMVGLSCVESLLQVGTLTDVEDMDWNAQAFDTAKTYTEYTKDMATERLSAIYALVAEGEKKGIALTEEDEKEIAGNIEELKKAYGDEFETILKKNGYQSEDTLLKLQRMEMLYQKILEDAQKDLSKYVSIDKLKAMNGPEKVTVKHILVAFDEEALGDVTDEKKAAAKKEAEEVLKKLNEGGDFDALMTEYNDDPGATPEGYTFADDGTMVKQFTDASFALEIGETSGLVETSYGYHIIRRMERNYTVDEYLSYLSQNASVIKNEENFSNTVITVDLKELFGATAE